jgi:HPt (histidine-containing phosphotransfer) domain-containing protein
MISWDRVNELRDEVGEEDFLEVVELFLEEVDEVVLKLEASPEQSRLEEDLHFLKGSALNLGFRALSAICDRGEKNAADQQYDQIDIKEVLQTYAQSKAEFNGGAGVEKIAV